MSKREMFTFVAGQKFGASGERLIVFVFVVGVVNVDIVGHCSKIQMML